MFDLRETAKNKVLVAAHRGTWMGNIPCNTTMAFNAALAAGADIVELDVTHSKDGTLYVFHPGRELFYLQSPTRISEMNDERVAELRFYNSDGNITQYPVQKLDDVLEELKNRCFINVDKFFDWPEEIAACIRRHGMVDQCLIKTNQGEQWYALLEKIAPDFPYMAMAYEQDVDSEMLLTRGINFVGVETHYVTDDSEFATAAYQERMHKLNLLTWVNTIVYNYKAVLAGGHSDDVSIMGHPEQGWGHVADLGYDIIQTDWVSPCVAYLKARGYRK